MAKKSPFLIETVRGPRTYYLTEGSLKRYKSFGGILRRRMKIATSTGFRTVFPAAKSRKAYTYLPNIKAFAKLAPKAISQLQMGERAPVGRKGRRILYAEPKVLASVARSPELHKARSDLARVRMSLRDLSRPAPPSVESGLVTLALKTGKPRKELLGLYARFFEQRLRNVEEPDAFEPAKFEY